MKSKQNAIGPSPWEGPIWEGGCAIEEAKTKFHTKCVICSAREGPIQDGGVGQNLGREIWSPPILCVCGEGGGPAGKVNIGWAVLSKIVNFDHIFVQAVSA